MVPTAGSQPAGQPAAGDGEGLGEGDGEGLGDGDGEGLGEGDGEGLGEGLLVLLQACPAKGSLALQLLEMP
jgi:hypothetical protein